MDPVTAFHTEACVIPVPWNLACAWADGKLDTGDLIASFKSLDVFKEPFGVFILRLGHGKKGMFQMLDRVGWMLQFPSQWKGIVWYAHTPEVEAWGQEFGVRGCAVYENAKATDLGPVAGHRYYCLNQETRFTKLARKVFLTRYGW